MNYRNNEYRALAEWERQSFVQLTWPNANTDWNYIRGDAVRTFCDIAKAIIRFEKLVIVCQDANVPPPDEGTAALSGIYRIALPVATKTCLGRGPAKGCVGT